MRAKGFHAAPASSQQDLFKVKRIASDGSERVVSTPERASSSPERTVLKPPRRLRANTLQGEPIAGVLRVCLHLTVRANMTGLVAGARNAAPSVRSGAI
eukprot:3393184-Prymnesium_polylepis.1